MAKDTTTDTNRRQFVRAAGTAAALVAAAAPMTAPAQAQPRPAPKTMGARFRELMSGRAAGRVPSVGMNLKQRHHG